MMAGTAEQEEDLTSMIDLEDINKISCAYNDISLSNDTMLATGCV